MGQSVATETWQSGGRICSKENSERSSQSPSAATRPHRIGKPWQGNKENEAESPGPDGWTCQFLKDLDEAGVQGLKEQMIEWERQGRLPGQLCVALVTMLAKNDKIERPIGLTHYAYRAWARTRWPLYETWAREFTQNTPWDKAKKGVSSLDVALARIIRHETARARKQCGVTLLLDIEAFYENIQHEKLISQGLQHHFPAVVLNGAMEIYQGPRYIEGEGVAVGTDPVHSRHHCRMPICARIEQTNDSPDHPTLCGTKRESGTSMSGLTTLVLMLRPETLSTRQKEDKKFSERWKTRLQGEGLTLSIKKTVFVVTDGKTRKAMNTIRETDEPEVRFQAKDLGVDTSGWRPQKNCHSQRQAKQGAKKENQIGSSSGGQAWGANQSFQRFHHVDRSVRTPSYGSSPKKDEVVQACHGRLAGTAVLRGD